MKEQKTRDYYFDNFKAILILFVVLGHFLAPLQNKYHIVDVTVTYIYFFHMPAFVFVCGYFSKKNDWVKLVKTLLIPYVAFQVIEAFLVAYVKQEPRVFRMVYPKFSLWFLLALFIWRLVINELSRVKGLFVWAMMFALAAGFESSINSYLALSRTIVFFPFFVAGYQFNKEKFLALCEKWKGRLVGSVVLTGFGIACYYVVYRLPLSYLTYKAGYGKHAYGDKTVFIRLITIMISFVLIAAIAAVVPRKKHWFSYIGERTMTVYLLHSQVYLFLLHGTSIYDFWEKPYFVLAVVAFSVGLVWLLSQKPFDFFMKTLMSAPLECFIKGEEDGRYQDPLCKGQPEV